MRLRVVDVHFGSFAAATADGSRGRFTPKRTRGELSRPLRANSGLMQCNIIAEAQTEKRPRGGLS